MSTAQDPFSLVYAELWATVLSHPRSNIIRPGNRIRFDGESRTPIKEEISVSDTPELMLVLDGGNYNLHRTSATTQITKRYTWIIATGDLRIDTVLHPVEWMLLESSCDMHRRLCALRWSGQPEHFVTRVDYTALTEGFTDPARNRGIRGWSAVASVEVEMHLKTSALLAWRS